MNGWTIAGIIALILIVVFGCGFVIDMINTPPSPEAVVINEIEREKIIGVLEIIRMHNGRTNDKNSAAVDPEGTFWFRFFMTDGSQRCIPSDCGYWPVYPTDGAVGLIEKCGKPATVFMSFIAMKPTVPALEAGEKMSIYLNGAWIIGEKGCPVDVVMPEDTNPQFRPFDPLKNAFESLSELPGCMIRIWTMGRSYEEYPCAGDRYYETANIVGSGPIPADRGRLFVYATSGQGVWAYGAKDFAELAWLTYLIDVPVVDTSDFDVISLYIEQSNFQPSLYLDRVIGQ